MTILTIMNINCKLQSAMNPKIGAKIAIKIEVNCDSTLKTLARLAGAAASPTRSTIKGLLIFNIT